MKLNDALTLGDGDLLKLVAELWYDGPIKKDFGILYADGMESWGDSLESTMQRINEYDDLGIKTELLIRADIEDWNPLENLKDLSDFLQDNRLSIGMTKIYDEHDYGRFQVSLGNTVVTHRDFAKAILLAFVVEFGSR
ncbi:hypothetical protein ABNB84_10350 [Paenibacillus larvae]